MKRKLDNREDYWLKKAKLKYGDKFDYSHVRYINFNTYVAIICPHHGLLMQTPSVHLSNGCKACNANRMTRDEFLEYAKKLHADKYDYSKTDYSHKYPLNDSMLITCKEHGDFVQKIEVHLRGHGCPKCKNKSKIRPDSMKTKDKQEINRNIQFAEPSGYPVKISFKHANSEVNVLVKTDPYKTKDAAKKFLNEIRMFTEMTNSLIIEEKIEEIKKDKVKVSSNLKISWRKLIINRIKKSVIELNHKIIRNTAL